MPPTTVPGRLAFPAQISSLEDQLRAVQTQQGHVVTDPTGASGDPEHGHATVVWGALKSICGISGYGLAVYASGAWHQVTGSGGGGGGPPTGAAGGDLTGEYPNPTLAAEVVTEAELASALLGPAASVFGLRKLGSGALEAMPGNTSVVSAATLASELTELEEDIGETYVTLTTEQTITGRKTLEGGPRLLGEGPAGALATNAPELINLTGGKGGKKTGTRPTGTVGGGFSLTSGLGGEAEATAIEGHGGRGGLFALTGGAGGPATATGTIKNFGGIGGEALFQGGNGGNATGVTSGESKGGLGGGAAIRAGTGGNATTGTGTRKGGEGGFLELSAGEGGTGTTENGPGGALKLRTGQGVTPGIFTLFLNSTTEAIVSTTTSTLKVLVPIALEGETSIKATKIGFYSVEPKERLHIGAASGGLLAEDTTLVNKIREQLIAVGLFQE